MPPHIKKCIMVAAPHTSNYDFFYARAALYIMRYKIRFLITGMDEVSYRLVF